MQLRILLEPSEDGGFTVSVPSLPGCISEGDSREDALANVREAIELYLVRVEDDTAGRGTAELVEIAVPPRSRASPTIMSSGRCSATAGL